MKLTIILLMLVNTSLWAKDSMDWNGSKSLCRNGDVNIHADGYHYCYCCQRGSTGLHTAEGVVCEATAQDIVQVDAKWGHLAKDSLAYKNAKQGLITDGGVRCGDLKSGTATERVRWERDRDSTEAREAKKNDEKEAQAARQAALPTSNLSNCQHVDSSFLYDRVILCDNKAYYQLEGIGNFDQVDMRSAKEQLNIACRDTLGRNTRHDEKYCATNDTYACCMMGSVEIRHRYYKRVMDSEEVRILNEMGITVDASVRQATPLNQVPNTTENSDAAVNNN